MNKFLQNHSVTLSIFLVLVGWFVVYQNAKRLATRAESKSMVEQFMKLVNEIVDLSVDFWLSPSKLSGGEALFYCLSVGSKLQLAQNYANFLLKRGIEISVLDLSQLHLSSTLDAESRNSLRLNQKRQRGAECADLGQRLSIHVQEMFERTHPPLVFSKDMRQFYLDTLDH